MFTELFVNNAQTVSETGAVLSDGRSALSFDPGLSRPYLDDRGRAWVDVTVGIQPRRDKFNRLVLNSSGSPIYDRKYEPQLVSDRIRLGLPVVNVNNSTTLRKDQWIMLDNVVGAAARARLRAYSDLRASSVLGGFDGMATPILEHEIINDPGEAIVDIDGLSEGRGFQPTFDLQGMPLPVVHSSFFLSSRFLAASRSKGQPQDTIRAEIAGRRVGETIERMTIGTVTPYTYGSSSDYVNTSKVYGYTTHPDRITKTDLTAPTGSNSDAIVDDVLEMRSILYDYNFFGPFMLYHSTNWDRFLDADYVKGSEAQGLASPGTTLRDRLRRIEGISDIRRLDYLSGSTYTMLLVQMTSDVCQAVNGMEITTIQWETHGGMKLNFKVLGIQAPRIRSVHISGTDTVVRKTGILHATDS